MKNNVVWTCILLAVFLTGCALSPLPAIDTYTVSPEWDDQRSQTTHNKQLITLKLAPIQGIKSFSGTEMLYSDLQHGRNSYAYSRWNDAPIRLMQTYIQVTLEHRGQFFAVVPHTSVSEADYLLEGVLVDFSQHFKNDGNSESIIRMHFYLINYRTKKIIATREFIAVVPALTNNASGGADSLNQAAKNLVNDLVAWIADPLFYKNFKYK